MSRFASTTNLSRLLDQWAPEITTLSGKLYEWMESPDFRYIYHRTGTGMDHLRAGALQLVLATVNHLDRLVDWDKSETGVFAYDYCEGSLPALLQETLSPREWHELAENYRLPADLGSLITGWVHEQPGLACRESSHPRFDPK